MNISPQPETPPYPRMITEAILCLKEKSGSSHQAIATFIAEKYYGGGRTRNFRRMLSIHLDELTKLGKLVKVKRSFKLPVKEKSVMENKTEGGMGFMGIEKDLEKIGGMIEVGVPRISEKEELNLEEWKKVAEENDLALVESLEKLMQAKQKLEEVKGKVLDKIQALEDSENEKQWNKEAQLLEKNDELRNLYKRRSEIIDRIPNFWSTVFMSYLLQRRVTDVDKQIIKYLESVDVEGRPYVTPEFRITLKFGENGFFQNPSVVKTIKYSRERIIGSVGTDIQWKTGKDTTAGFEEKSNDQSDTDMREENGTDIKWKTSKGITAGFEEKSSDQSDTDMRESRSFFTWFEDSTEKLHDEVANSIARALWVYAPDYYV